MSRDALLNAQNYQQSPYDAKKLQIVDLAIAKLGMRSSPNP
jgi:hypothetical protein